MNEIFLLDANVFMTLTNNIIDFQLHRPTGKY